jgi:hypothetical protein
MLQVARITGIQSTRERCVSKARRICDRLALWLQHYPLLRDIHTDLENLIHRLPP